MPALAAACINVKSTAAKQDIIQVPLRTDPPYASTASSVARLVSKYSLHEIHSEAGCFSRWHWADHQHYSLAIIVHAMCKNFQCHISRPVALWCEFLKASCRNAYLVGPAAELSGIQIMIPALAAACNTNIAHRHIQAGSFDGVNMPSVVRPEPSRAN